MYVIDDRALHTPVTHMAGQSQEVIHPQVPLNGEEQTRKMRIYSTLTLRYTQEPIHFSQQPCEAGIPSPRVTTGSWGSE